MVKSSGKKNYTRLQQAYSASTKNCAPKGYHMREKIKKLPKTGLLFLGENKKTQTVSEVLKERGFLSIDNSQRQHQNRCVKEHKTHKTNGNKNESIT